MSLQCLVFHHYMTGRRPYWAGHAYWVSPSKINTLFFYLHSQPISLKPQDKHLSNDQCMTFNERRSSKLIDLLMFASISHSLSHAWALWVNGICKTQPFLLMLYRYICDICLLCYLTAQKLKGVQAVIPVFDNFSFKCILEKNNWLHLTIVRKDTSILLLKV